MTGKKATIKLLPIELNYDINGYISSAKLATEIVDKDKSTVELVPVDAVDKYVPLKNIEDINIEIEEQDRSEIQQVIDSLELDLKSAEGELAAQITQQITELKAQLNVVQEIPTTDAKADETSIEDAKKIIKQSSGLGDFVIDVNEEGDIVIPQFDDLLQPMQNAKNVEDLELAYANAMIAVTEGNIPGDSNALSNAIELKKNEKELALSLSSRKNVKAKDLQENDYLVVKKAIFDSVREDLFIVESITGNKVKIKSLSTGKSNIATDEILKTNFKKHNKMAYEIINEPVAITEEDTAAVVETKNNLDEIRKNETMLNKAKENSKSVSKLERFSKLKDNSPNC
jgi:hypothetical protein